MTRGFTLMEAMVSLAIAGIIVAAGATAVQSINYSIQDTKRRAAMWDQAKRIEEYIISQMQGAGGGVIRPFEVLVVDNNFGCRPIAGLPACDGHDRVELRKVVFGMPECRVSGSSGVNLHVDNLPDGTCCLDVPPSVPPVSPPLSFAGTYAMLLGDNGVSVPLYLNTRTGGCRINAPTGLGNNPGPGFNGAVPGTLVAMVHEMFFVDGNSHKLRRWRDGNGDRAASDGELTDLHSNVYDMQVALGYDGNPEDGREVDDGTDADEWLHNHLLDPTFGFRSFLTVTADQLRMVQIGVVVGTRARMGAGAPTQLLDGPAFIDNGVAKAATTSKAYLRNVSVFSQ